MTLDDKLYEVVQEAQDTGVSARQLLMAVLEAWEVAAREAARATIDEAERERSALLRPR